MSNKRSLLGSATAFCLVFVLVGCSGGDGGMGSGSVKTNTTSATDNGQQAPTAADTFITRILAVINSTLETAEPVDIESITVTSPEDAEPVPAT